MNNQPTTVTDSGRLRVEAAGNNSLEISHGIGRSLLTSEFCAAFAAGSAAQLEPAVTLDFRLYIPEMQDLPWQPVYYGVAGFAQLLRDPEGTIDYTLFEKYDRACTPPDRRPRIIDPAGGDSAEVEPIVRPHYDLARNGHPVTQGVFDG